MSKPAHSSRPVAHHLVWNLSLLGHVTHDVARHILAQAAQLGRLPLIRGLAVASMVALIAQDDLGTLPARTTGTFAERSLAPVTADAPAVAVSAAAAPAAVRPIADAAALAYIRRYEHVAAAEHARFGLDAGVVLAAAIVASEAGARTVGQSPFGAALDGTFESPWAAWRAMSVSVMAEAGASPLAQRADWIALVAGMYPNADQVAARLEYTLQRYTL